MGRFCLFVYTGVTDRFRSVRGVLYNLASFLKAHPIRKKQRVDLEKIFI